jgi:hypothetical protein
MIGGASRPDLIERLAFLAGGVKSKAQDGLHRTTDGF